MNTSLFFSLLISILLTLAFANDRPTDVVELPAMNCLPTSCGNVTGIVYPFWVNGQQPAPCGLPNFNLSCRNEIPTLEISFQAYQVREISYKKQTLLLVNTDFVGTKCPVLHSNLTLSLTPFSISSANRELVFLFDCSGPQPDYYKIPCSGSNATFAYWGDHFGSSGTCQSAIMPVMSYADSDVSDYLRVVKTGFLVDWTAADCTACRQSNGQCGYSEMNDNFICICPDRVHSTSCIAGYNISNGATKKKIIVGSAVGAGLLVVCLSLLLYFYKHRKVSNLVILGEKDLNNNKKIEALLEEYGSVALKRYSYSNVKEITKDFHEKLGQGGFGTVYKGTLRNGHAVAVKILNGSKGDGEEFINEVASICRTSHVNVVSLLGFCHDGSKKALIYDFMCNGSLEKLIYSEKSKTTHDWQKLYEIAVGIARGLEYLHRGCNTRIVHFDIKPHNILLDQNFCPKISDFGLAKLCLKKESIISIAGARGTIGYIAPEVFSRNFGVVSSKSDVYSYGMLVLDIVGGRKNPNEGVENSSEVYFPHWIYAQLNQNGNLSTCDVTDESEEIVRKIVLVGLWCIQTVPENRPTMSRVIEMMEGSVDDLQIPPKTYLSSSPFGSIIGTSSTVQDVGWVECSSYVNS